MNEIIKDLAERADDLADEKIQMPGEYHPDWHDVRDQFFAELLLSKVMSICEDLGDQGMDGHYCVDHIRREFGL
jgi:hypothetical protein